MRSVRQIAFVLYPGVTPLDIVGPLTVLRDLRIGSPYRTVVVAERIRKVPTDTDLALRPTATFADVPAPFGLIVPGAGTETLRALQDERLLGYVRHASRTATVVGSTGNGALVLAAAGLLGGRRAAIHWAWADLLRSFGAVPDSTRWTIDGRFLTAAGGTAGIDAMLELAARLTRPSRARLAQLAMEYDPQPPFGALRAADLEPDLAAAVRRGDTWQR